jgi:hypothetical protein
MSTRNASLSDGLGRAHDESTFHVWNGIGAAIASLFVPLIGVLAACSGYNLVRIMERRWVGVLGAVNFVMWVFWLLFVFWDGTRVPRRSRTRFVARRAVRPRLVLTRPRAASGRCGRGGTPGFAR